MKIGIISDTHGSVQAWLRALSGPFQGADIILHAGDVLYHGPRNPLPEEYRPGELADLINSCPVPVLVARGNCDADVDQVVLGWPIQSPYVFAQMGDLRIMVTHGHLIGEDRQKELAGRFKLNCFVSGHTHVPTLEKAGGCLFMNPGSAALPKQEGGVPTVGLIENDEISVVDLRTGERLMGLALR